MSSSQPYEGSLSRNSSIEYVGVDAYRIRQQDFFQHNKIKAASFYAAPTGYKSQLSNIQGPVIVNSARKESEHKFAAENNYKLYIEDRQQHIKTYFGESEAWIPSGNISGQFVNGKQEDFKDVTLQERLSGFVNTLSGGRDLPSTLDTGLLVKGEAYKTYRKVLEDVYNYNLQEEYKIEEGLTIVRGDVATKTIASALQNAQTGDEVYFSRAFAPHKSVDKSLIDAAKRGVRVNVITNNPVDRNASDLTSQEALKSAGVRLTYSETKFAHLKEFSIRGSRNLSITGSTNYTSANYANRSADVSLLVEGKNSLGNSIDNQLRKIFEVLSESQSTAKPSFYEKGEFAFLFKTQYGEVQSRAIANLTAGVGTIGLIKSTKLNENYFDRHLRRDLPKYSGFTSTYEAITGIRANSAIQQMDEAVGAPSVGHQINRALGFKVYTDSLGVVGSLVSLGGRAADLLSGHYAYKQDMARRKGVKGSLKKFQAMLDRSWEEQNNYQGGPIEQGVNALYGAVKSLTLATVSYGAMLAGQYGLQSFLEEGARRIVEPTKQQTAFQALMSKMYLSEMGMLVANDAQAAMRLSIGGALTPEVAMSTAMRGRNVTSNDLLGKGLKIPSVVNRMRALSAGMMDFALPPILNMVVPSNHLPSALRAADELVTAIGMQIRIDEQGLHNLNKERAQAVGRAIEKVGSHIPLELHLWMPGIRQALGVNGTTVVNPDSHHPLGGIDTPHPSLSSVMGEGILRKTIEAFMQTVDRTGKALADPTGVLKSLKSEYALTRRVEMLDRQLAKALEGGTATEAGVRSFFHQQARLSERLKPYSNSAAVSQRSAGNGVLSQGVFKKGLGRAALSVAGLFVADFALDEMVLRTQGADLFQQLSLTRAVRNSEGNIIQIELNGVVPIGLTAAVAGTSALAAGHIFPTIYGASKFSSGAMQQLAKQTGSLAQVATEFAETAGARARFNYKAAGIGAVIGLVALKSTFIVAAEVGKAFFPVRGVKLDPESEVVTGKLLSILNRTRRRNYTLDSEGNSVVKDSVLVGSLVTREVLKQVVDNLSASDIRTSNRSAGSSFYSVAAQFTNTGFVQTALVQRTDSLKGRTTYAFGIQLFASAGLGLTPNLPFGLVTQQVGSKQKKDLAKQTEKSYLDRYAVDGVSPIFGKPIQAALDVFGFLSFEPKSQIGQGLLGLGALGYINAGAEALESRVLISARPGMVKTEARQDLAAFAKVAKLGLQLTTALVKYSTALTDFIPRVVGSGLAYAYKDLAVGSRFELLQKSSKILNKAKFGILGYALGVAMSDPYLGVEALDSTDGRAGEHPFTNPVNRLATAATMAAAMVYSADSLGLSGRLNPNSVLSQVIPGARAAQQMLSDSNTTQLRKSGARVSLIAGLVFGSHIAANALARTIGSFGGESALAATYQRFGLLRLLSGVSATEYREGSRYEQRNLLGDIAGNLISKIPFIGLSIAEMTGLYKDDSNLYAPIVGTPYGVSFANDGTTRGYGQVQNISTDISTSAYTKFQLGFSKDLQQMFANLEAVDFTKSGRPDELAYAVLIGGAPRSRQMRISDISKYATANIDGDLVRAFNVKLHRRNWVKAQRATELYLHELKTHLAFGDGKIWTGMGKNKLSAGRVGVLLGLNLKTIEYSSSGAQIGTGRETDFMEAYQGSAYKERNRYTGGIFQGITDMYNAYTPQTKKGDPNLPAAAILSIIGTVVTGSLFANTLMGAAELIGALEVVKYGKSSTRLATDRLNLSKQFRSRNSIDFQQTYLSDGTPSSTMRPGKGNQGVGFNRVISLEQYELQEQTQVRRAYRQGLTVLSDHLKRSPMDMAFNDYSGGKMANAYDLLLAGKSGEAVDIFQSKFVDTLAGPKGVLTQSVGNSDYYKVFINQPDFSPLQYAAHVADRAAYDPLVAYAQQLNERGLDTWQKRELLAAAKLQIEAQRVEAGILAVVTNSLDNTPQPYLPQLEQAPMGAGLGQTFKRASKGAGLLLGSYFVFGKDAYALAEGTSFIISGENRPKRRAAASQIYNTATGLGFALGLQKVVSSVFGLNQFSLGALGVTLIAALGLNIAADKVKDTSFGRGVKALEAGTKDVAIAGIMLVGDLLSWLPGIRQGSDLLSKFVFTPLGMKIGDMYNQDSRTSQANAILAELFLPQSIFKTNSYTPRRTSVGYIPFVAAAQSNVDLRAYYRAQNEAELKGTMSANLDPKYTSGFTLGRVDNKNYTEKVLYDRYFNMQDRSAASPLSNFGMSSNYRMSETQVLAIGMRAAASDFHRYGRSFRRPAQPLHDYFGQFASGLGVGNEVARIATQAQSNWGRPVADAYTTVDRVARTVFSPVIRSSRIISQLVAAGGDNLRFYLAFAINPLLRIPQLIGESIAHLLGGTRIVAGTVSQAVAEASAGGVRTGVSTFEDKLSVFAERITRKYSGPVAHFVLEALRGTGTLVAAGASLAMKGIEKIPTVEPVNYNINYPRLPNLGYNSWAPLNPKHSLARLGSPIKSAANFIRGNLPFYLDAFQMLPATYALQGANEERLTLMERQRLYEQQGSAVAGTAIGLVASALRFNLITTVILTVGASFIGGQLSRKGARQDYDNESTFYRQVQSTLGIVTTAASAASSLISYYRRVQIYNNYTEIFTNEYDSKRARAVYDAKFEDRMQKIDAKIERLADMPDSAYKRQQLQQLNQQRIGMRFEYNHEQAHVRQFDIGSQEFVATNPILNAKYQQYITPGVENSLLRLAQRSAQERLYENPNIDAQTYKQIIELEHQAHLDSYIRTLDESSANHNLDLRHTPEQHLDHYIRRMDRQTARGRSVQRTPGILPPDALAEPIERLYNPTASGTIAKGRTGFRPAHYEKFGALVSTGFTKGARLVTGLQTFFGLPTALAETALNKQELSDIQQAYGTSNVRAIDTALIERGKNNARYAYVGTITGALSAVFTKPVAIVGIALYGGLASFGGSIPFTDIPLVPTLGRGELAQMYSNYMRSKMRSGDYAYDPWSPATSPINSLKHHDFDGADRQMVHAVANRTFARTTKAIRDTVGFFKERPRTRGGSLLATGLAALTYFGYKVLGLRDTSLMMFAPISATLATGGYYGLKRLSAWALTKLPTAIAAVQKYFTAGLSREVTLSGKTVLKAGANPTLANKVVLLGQGILQRFGFAFATLKDVGAMYQAWNQPIAYGKFTGLPSKYFSQGANIRAGVSRPTQLLMNLLSAPQRMFNFGHRVFRSANMVGTFIAHSIEDFGIRGGLSKQLPKALKEAGTNLFGNRLREWFDAADNWVAKLFNKHAMASTLPLINGKVGEAVAKKLNWITPVAKWVYQKITPYLPAAGKLALAAAALFYSARTQGMAGFATTAAVGGGLYAIYRYGKGLPVGKAIANQFLRNGVSSTLLTGVALTIDTQTILTTSYQFGTSDRAKMGKLEYQQAYVQSAQATSGLISTLSIFPNLGIIRGLFVSGLLNFGMTSIAEQKANERLEQYRAGDTTHSGVLVAKDFIKGSIEQSLAAAELGHQYNKIWQTKAGRKFALTVSRFKPIRAWRSMARGFRRVSTEVIKSRALRIFGDSAEAVSTGIKSLQTYGEVAGTVITKGLKTLTKIIDVGLIGYGTYKVVYGKNDAERKEGYRMALGAVGSIVGFALAAAFGAPLQALPGGGQVAHVGLTVTSSLAGQAIGEGLGDIAAGIDKSIRGTGTSISSFNVGDFFNNLLGGTANAAALPSSAIPNLLPPSQPPDNSLGIDRFWERAKNKSSSILNYFGSQWRKSWIGITSAPANMGAAFALGIGNLYKAGKLKWGKLTDRIGGNRTIVGFNQTKPIVPGNSNTGTAEMGVAFTGNNPTVAAVTTLARTMPANNRDTVLSNLKQGGTVFSGREVSVDFLNNSNVIQEMRGKTLKFDANFKSISDITAMLESGMGNRSANTMASYNVQSAGNSNSGRYQIIYGTDTKLLGNLIKGGVTGWDATNQDKAFAARFFWKDLRGGGNEYLNFIKGGYKYEDFVKFTDAASRQYEVFRSSRNTYKDGSSAGKTFMDRNYGSAEKGNQILYQMFLMRKAMYEGNTGGAPTQTSSTAAKPIKASSSDLGFSPVNMGKNSALVKQGAHSYILQRLSDGAVVDSYNANQTPDAVASTLKVLLVRQIQTEIKAGRISLSDRVSVTKGNFSDGDEQNKIGQSYTVSSLIEKTLRTSDNTTANMLIDRLGGFAAITKRAKEQGYNSTQVNRYFSIARQTASSNKSTAADVNKALLSIFKENDAITRIAQPTLGDPYILNSDGSRGASTKFGFRGENATKIGNTSKVISGASIVIIKGKEYGLTQYYNKGDTPASRSNLKQATDRYTKDLTSNLQSSITPAQADAIMNPPDLKSTAPIPTTKPTTTQVATVKYAGPQRSVPVVAGRPLKETVTEVAVNLSVENGQLKAIATQQATAETYFNKVNTPASTRNVAGYKLQIA